MNPAETIQAAMLSDHQVLAEVAERLRNHTRPMDMAAYNYEANLIIRLAIIAEHLLQNPRKP